MPCGNHRPCGLGFRQQGYLPGQALALTTPVSSQSLPKCPNYQYYQGKSCILLNAEKNRKNTFSHSHKLDIHILLHKDMVGGPGI